MRKVTIYTLFAVLLLFAMPSHAFPPSAPSSNATQIQGLPIDAPAAGDDGKYIIYDHGNLKFDYDTPAGGGDMTAAVWDGDTDGFIDADAGGTDIDTSAATGVPSIAAGTWSVAATLTHELGGLEADVSAYDGLVKITGGSTSAVTVTAFAESILDDANEATFKATVNLEAGTDFYDIAAADAAHQAADATLLSIAALGTAADKLAYTTALDTWAETALTAFGRSILDDADEATFKATVNLEIGTDAQAWSAVLDTVAGSTYAGDNAIVTVGTIGTGVWQGTAIDGAYIAIHTTTLETTVNALDEILMWDESASAIRRITRGNFLTGLGVGQAIIFDIGDDGGDDSSDVGEIATSGDTNSIFTEPSADKILIDLSNNWPGADLATTATTANAGDSATAFFSSGTIEHEYGGLEDDVSAYAGLVKITGGATSAVTVTAFAESILDDADEATFKATVNLEAGTDFYAVAAADAAFEAELNNSAGLLAALSDETGTGVAVFGTSPEFTTSITFNAVTDTIAGIQNQNLLDKTAAETISGVYTHSANIDLDDGVGASPSLIFTDATNETWTISKADGGNLDIDINNAADRVIDIANAGAGEANLTIDGDITSGNITIADAAITSDTGAISFNDENLSTSGTLGAGETTLTGDLNLLSSNADPGATAGAIKHDSTVTGFTGGALRWHDGAGLGVRLLVDLDSDPGVGEDDYQVTYDADADKFYMKVDETAGSPTWDSIGNPTGNDEIDFGAYTIELNVTDFRIGDGGSNYWQFTANKLTNAGTATLDLAALSDITVATAAFIDQSVLTTSDVTFDDVTVSGTGTGLKVGNGTPTQTMNGEDAYIEGFLEVDGPIYADGGIIAASSTDPYFTWDVTDADDTDWSLGVNADAGASSDDFLELRQSATVGNELSITFDPVTGDVRYYGVAGGTGGDDAYYTLWDVTNPTANRTITVPDANVTLANIAVNTTHKSSDGSDHTFLDQSVVSGATPTFTGTNFTGIPAAALPDADDDGATKGVAAFDNTDFNATSGVVTIVDDGHAHTTTSISGLNEADISDLAHTATAITDGLIVEADLNEDSGTPTDEDLLEYDSTGANFNWVTKASVVSAARVGAASANLDDSDASIEWEDAADLDSDGSITDGAVDFSHLSAGAKFQSLISDNLGDTSTPHVLTAAETTNKVLSNYDSSGADRVFTMPACHAAGNVIFPIGDEFQVDIEPDTGDLFYLNGTAMAANEHIQNTADTLGERIVGYCVNINGTLRWMFYSSDDAWVEETP